MSDLCSLAEMPSLQVIEETPRLGAIHPSKNIYTILIFPNYIEIGYINAA